MATASVGSWKTEEIGFEVQGRVEFVVEANTMLEGRVFDSKDNPINAGTPIARLESERFELQVARANSELERANQNLLAAQTELTESIPAQISAAVASRTLAERDFLRSQKLVSQNAASQGELDVDRANFENAVAQVKQLEAVEKAKQAEVESLKSQVEQSKQNVRDAERDLEDCTLYSSFTGQVAEVSVVPGSVVAAGEPVVTLQMMDPIKVEMEVSAQQSRQVQRTEVYPVHVTMPDGSVEIHEGFLNQIDSFADPQMRTYTLTFLVINRLLSTQREKEVATTRDIWRLDLPFLPGAEDGRLFAAENSILFDEQGAYLWQVTNATAKSRTPSDNLYTVRKIRITPKDFRIPYLGNWLFQEVVVNDEDFDPEVNLIVGELETDGEAEDWAGDKVQVDSGARWMLRPGDLVKVDLSRSAKANGYYVPIGAITRSGEETAIYVVDTSGDRQLAKRVNVRIPSVEKNGQASGQVLVEPIGDIDLEGMPLVLKGSHYLVDGEPVSAALATEGVE